MAAVAVTREKVPAMRRMFSLMDRDGSGKISKNELNDLLHSQGYHPSEAELETIMCEIDADHNGEIDFEEFVGYCAKTAGMNRSMSQESRDIHDVFKYFDKNDDGYLTATEIRQVMRELGRDISEEQAEQMIADEDKEGSGRITYQRFKSMVLSDETDGPAKKRII